MAYDTVVVGSGSAGGILAGRLSEDADRSVLLLEAGHDYPDLSELPDSVKWGIGRRRQKPIPQADHLWNFVARFTETSGPRIVPRGKVIGGSSARNAQIYLRGTPEDYDMWAHAGNDEWSYQNLLPYMRLIETDPDFGGDFHGTDGPMYVRRFKEVDRTDDQRAFYQSARDLGYPDCPDHNDPDATGVGPTPFNNIDGVRISTHMTYIDPARERPNLDVRGDCLVHRVVFSNGRAVGVEYESDGEMVSVEASEVILSAGAVGSPHLLMASGVGPAGHLATVGVPVVHDVPGVGQNLRDHPQVWMQWSTQPDFEQSLDSPAMQFTLRYTATGSHLRNDMLVHPLSYAQLDPYRVTSKRYDRPGVQMVPGLYLAVSAGSMKLRDPDPRIQPYLDYNMLSDPFDLSRLREAVRVCLEMAEHDLYRPIIDERITPTDDEIASDDAMDAWMRREVRTSHHISGTAKMGPSSDPMAVVDQYGGVHGIDGLRVVDASIVPDCPRVNTNVTALVIGERMADLIRQEK